MKIQPQKDVENKYNDEPKHKDGHLTPNKRWTQQLSLEWKWTQTWTNKIEFIKLKQAT
jgi:hypothetical protein